MLSSKGVVKGFSSNILALANKSWIYLDWFKWRQCLQSPKKTCIHYYILALANKSWEGYPLHILTHRILCLDLFLKRLVSAIALTNFQANKTTFDLWNQALKAYFYSYNALYNLQTSLHSLWTITNPSGWLI